MRPMTMTALRLLATVTLLTAFPPAPIFAQAERPPRIGQGIEPPRNITSLNGVPVPVIMTVTVRFTLTDGSARYRPSAMPTIASYPVEVPGAPRSSVETPRTPQWMLPARPRPVFIGDVDFMKSYQDTIQTLQKEADSDPELQQVLRNLRRMIGANGANA